MWNPFRIGCKKRYGIFTPRQGRAGIGRKDPAMNGESGTQQDEGRNGPPLPRKSRWKLAWAIILLILAVATVAEQAVPFLFPSSDEQAAGRSVTQNGRRSSPPGGIEEMVRRWARGGENGKRQTMRIVRGGEYVVVELSPEEASIRDLLQSAVKTADKRERRHLLYKIVDRYGDADSELLRQIAVDAACELAETVDGAAEKAAVLDAAIARHKSGVDINSSLGAQVARAMRMRAGCADTAREKRRILDEAIATFRAANYGRVQAEVLFACRDRAKAGGDREENLRLLDDAIRLYGGARRGRAQRALAVCMNKRAQLTDDPAERLRRFDEIIDKYKDGNRYMQTEVARALVGKAGVVADPEAKLAVYAQVLGRYKNTQDKHALIIVRRSVKNTIALISDMPDADKRLDELTSSLEGSRAAEFLPTEP